MNVKLRTYVFKQPHKSIKHITKHENRNKTYSTKVIILKNVNKHMNKIHYLVFECFHIML